MRILDPGTLFTDWLLAAYTAWLAWTLYREAWWTEDRAMNLWYKAFCVVALSAFMGGIWHGFSTQLKPGAAAMLWGATMILAVTASLLFLLAVLRAYASGRLLGILCGVAVAKFALFVVWLAVKNDFNVVVYDSALTMFVMVVLSTWGAWAREVASAPWVLGAVLVSMLAALFQQGRVSVHPHFDHNDLYHAIQMGAMYLLFRAGMLLRAQQTADDDFETTTQRLPMVREK